MDEVGVDARRVQTPLAECLPGFDLIRSLCMLAFMFGAPGWMEMLVIALVILLLFGNRLPSVMRSLGRGVVEFKKGLSDQGSDEEHEEKAVTKEDAKAEK
ncbi:MAG: twin-arginine translocase TatA/TatE family subunit [Thermogutta sp.]